ncbi:MAG: hypothetical protein AB7D06_18735 [Pedobacter sp.]
MYEDGIREYRDAKRKAARRFGSEKALCLGSHLPSNAEIHQELRRLISLYEEEVLPERLLEMRMLALKYLELFGPFTPYLVGSVLSGVVTASSDVDLHLFADDVEEVEGFLDERDIPWEFELVTVRHGGEFHDYPHLYMEEEGYLIECSVYPRSDRHNIPTSSITGRTMERANAKRVRQIIRDMMES